MSTSARFLTSNVEGGIDQVDDGIAGLHHLLLHRLLLALHGAAVGVSSIVKAERTTAVGIALELLDGGSSV